MASVDVRSALRSHDALGLAQLLRGGELGPEELVEAALEEIRARNPRLNAVVHVCEAEARSRARELADLPREAREAMPLWGVPILLKDLGQSVRGCPETHGSRSLQGHRASGTSRFAEALLEAGAVVLGFTNTPEFGLWVVTEPEAYGPTRNPWDVSRSPGGSSGGSAAAVAARLVPLAGASDGGGSIRIPAAYTGLFGLKPSRGRTPIGPARGRGWQGAATHHVLTRSVRDSALVLDVLWQRVRPFEPGGAFPGVPFAGSFAEAGRPEVLERLKPRVAFSTAHPFPGEAPHPSVREAVERAAAYLAGRGFAVEEVPLPYTSEDLVAGFLPLVYAETYRTLRALARRNRPSPSSGGGEILAPPSVEAATYLLGRLGETIPAAEAVECLERWDALAARLDDFFTRWDLFLTPAAAILPPPIGSWRMDKALEGELLALAARSGEALQKDGRLHAFVVALTARTPYTQAANMAGLPAASLPLGTARPDASREPSAEGRELPVGVHVLAPRGREDLLLAFAAWWETSDLWRGGDEPPLLLQDDRG
ncbi:MAG: amidase [Brockia lithotrophica]|nr:amidase [Brockia lithotrophica]